MITEQQFLDRVRVVAKPRTDRTALNELLKRIQGKWDIPAGIREAEDRAYLYEREVPKLSKIPGLAYFFDISTAKDVIEDESIMDSWVYDRPTKTVILNIERGAHEMLLYTLYCVHTGKDTSWDRKVYEAAAESYITEGFGFSLSSAGNYPTKGRNVELNAQEKIVFSKRKFIEI